LWHHLDLDFASDESFTGRLSPSTCARLQVRIHGSEPAVITQALLLLGTAVALATAALALGARLAAPVVRDAGGALAWLEELAAGVIFILKDPRSYDIPGIPILDPEGGGDPRGPAAAAPGSLRGTFTFGACTIDMPVDQLAALVTAAEGALGPALRAAAEAMQAAGDEAPGAPRTT
jgi:hypothetical protein